MHQFGNNGVLYGFSKLDSESIRLMGVTDINTYSTNFAYNSATRKYMSAKTLPYNSRRVYNEFGIERKGTIPDYIVLEDDVSEDVKRNSYKAASQFEIPVLFIDKKEIVNEQLTKIQTMLGQFEETKNPELLKIIINTYETNVSGWLLNRTSEEDKSYTANIDNSRFQNDFEKIWQEIYGVISEYLNEQNTKGITNGELRRVMEIILEERDLYKDSEKIKPISKTTMSFDSEEIIRKINSAFAARGDITSQVDLKHIPTAKEYSTNMRKIIENALQREMITAEQVAEADRHKEEIRKIERGENQNQLQ